MTDIIPQKRCAKCGVEKPANKENFPPNKFTRDGFSSWCRRCHRDSSSVHRKRKLQDNPEVAKQEFAEYMRKWRANVLSSDKREDYLEHKRDESRRRRKTPGFQEKQRVYNQSEKRKAKQKEHSRRYRKSEKGKLSEAKRQSTDKGKARARIKTQRREARKLSLPNAFTVKDWHYALNYFNGCCAYCGAQQGFWNPIECDHFIPLASRDCPGTIPKNMLPACKFCNLSKLDRPARGWLEKKYGKPKANQILKRIQDYFDSL